MKIYLAGSESSFGQMFGNKIENAFYSYYYLRQTKKNLPKVKLHQLLFVDSGAHTFFSENENVESASSRTKKSKTKETPDQYFLNYVKWLKVNYDRLDYYAELDIGEIIGQNKVRKWREILKAEGLYKKCVPVYHPSLMSWKDYLNLLDTLESGYIAIEGDRKSRGRLNYNKIIKPAYERKIKVHGFAMTKTTVLNTYPFYSVDSTTWLQAVMFGTIPFHQNGKLLRIRYRDKNDFIKRIKNLNTDILFSDNKKEIRKYVLEFGINAYKQYEQYYTKLWKKRNINWDI